MEASSPRWKEITPSAWPWEREALAFVREGLPDHEPYRAWSNFEFIGLDGSINEVDFLVLTPKGFFLVEIKSRPGRLEGDAGTWTWTHEGGRYTIDNPLLLADRKAKRLQSLLSRQKVAQKTRLPFLKALVFCSAEDLECRLTDHGRQNVYLRDREPTAGHGPRVGIIAALTQRDPAGRAGDGGPGRVDAAMARMIGQAMDQAGVRESRRAWRLGDYELGPILLEGPGYQDRLATRPDLKGISRRVRLYTVGADADPERRAAVVRAAEREFRILEGIQHPGILRAVDYRQHPLGPALVFEHDPKAQRLDHFLRERGPSLTLDQRLNLLRQIADAIRHAHSRRLTHRGLGPQSILVADPDLLFPLIRVFSWQTAAREVTTSADPGRRLTVTQHPEGHVDEADQVFLAPEAFQPDAPGEPIDVFSLGTLTWLLFANTAPAATRVGLIEKLRAGGGLQIASALDGARPQLQDLVRYATAPDVIDRLETADDFLAQLEIVEEELTEPTEGIVDPLVAESGQRLDGGFLVKARLGKGSTATALLVERDGREHVLKVADAEHEARLRDEAEVLAKLRHQGIVESHGEVTVSGRRGLLMARAGEETLARRLRREGRLRLADLERFGEDLLATVEYLEQEGISHRDLKPENIGIVRRRRDGTEHLMLFDFSLARVPPDRIRAGTPPYLDPFLTLRRPARWDAYAERFAAGMVLHEMATGVLPTWGDGRSDPAVLECEVTIDAERFDAALRESLPAFFQKALAREPRRRFDNGEEMRHAWQGIFRALDRPARPTDDDVPDVDLDAALSTATLDSPLPALGLGARVLSALERTGATTARDLLGLPMARVTTFDGLGKPARRQITTLIRKLAERFPDVVGRPGRMTDDDEHRGTVSSVDLIAQQLLPGRPPPAAEPSLRALRMLLGLGDEPDASCFRSQTDVATALQVSRQRIGQVLQDARKRWLKNPSITALREDVVALLEAHGGVMTAAELGDAVLALRGSALPEPQRRQSALAVARAAVEAERGRVQPRFITRRSGPLVLVARDDPSIGVDGQALADWADALGRTADRLASQDPLPTPTRALEAAQAVAAPPGTSPPPARLLALAAAASQGAALSSRLEIYPRRMPAARALKLAQGALAGVRELSADEIRERVHARYPEAEELPLPPALDGLLAEVVRDAAWVSTARGGQGAYRLLPSDSLVSTPTSSLERRGTVSGHVPLDDPDVARAAALEERLLRSARDGGFLALTVSPRHLERARDELSRRFPVAVHNADAVLTSAMREAAALANARWDLVLAADSGGPGSADWSRLLLLVQRALPAVEAALRAERKTVLLTRAGLLARYGQMGLVERLRDEAGRPDGPHGLWVLVPSFSQHGPPALDGVSVPVLTPAQWAVIPDAWLENRHRALDPTSPEGRAA